MTERKQKLKKIIFKTCSRCGEKKPGFEFGRDKRVKDGRRSICRECKNREQLKYYYQNRDRILKNIREYEDNHKEKRSIYQKHYREKHGEHLKKQAKKWYKKNRKAIKERNLKYYNKHKEDCQARRKLWRAKNKDKIREYNREYKRKQRKVVNY